MGISVQMFNRFRERHFVESAVHDGYLVSPLEETVYDIRTGRAGAPD